MSLEIALLKTHPIDPAVMESHRAGDVEQFPSGYTTYLAPLPLPTEASPYSPYVSDLNDTYLDFGGGLPQVFSWQMTLGGPFTVATLVLLGGGECYCSFRCKLRIWLG